MAQYKVKAGVHVANGKKFRKGKIVESEKDLVKAFPEKFELVGGSESPEAQSEEAPKRQDGGRTLTKKSIKAGTQAS